MRLVIIAAFSVLAACTEKTPDELEAEAVERYVTQEAERIREAAQRPVDLDDRIELERKKGVIL